MVQIQELILAVNIAVNDLPVPSCQEIDANLDGAAAVNELVATVSRALNGCQVIGRRLRRQPRGSPN